MNVVKVTRLAELDRKVHALVEQVSDNAEARADLVDAKLAMLESVVRYVEPAISLAGSRPTMCWTRGESAFQSTVYTTSRALCLNTIRPILPIRATETGYEVMPTTYYYVNTALDYTAYVYEPEFFTLDAPASIEISPVILPCTAMDIVENVEINAIIDCLLATLESHLNGKREQQTWQLIHRAEVLYACSTLLTKLTETT